MSPQMLTLVLFFIIAAKGGCKGEATTLKFLEEYLYNARPFTRATAIVCWQKFGINLARSLHQGGFLNSLMDPFFATNNIDKILTQEKVIFIVRLSCPGSSEFLLKAGKKGSFGTPQKHWLLLMEDSPTPALNSLLSKLNIFINGSVTFAQRVEKNETRGMSYSYRMYDIYKAGENTSMTMYPIGEWSTSGGRLKHKIYPVQLKWKELGGIEIPISIVITNPETLNLLDSLHHKYDDTSTKMNYHLLSDIFRVMKAKPKFIPIDSWGYDHDGAYDGMVGQILRGEVEIGGTPLLMNRERIEILEYVGVTTHSRQPRLSSVGNIFLLPFGTSVWVSSFAMLVLAAIFLYSTIKTEKIFYQKNLDLGRELKKIGFDNVMPESKSKGNTSKMSKVKYIQDSWSDITFLTLGALCQQGFPAEARGTATRVVIIFLFLTIIVLYTSYSASIVVLLQLSSATIRTLEDLYHSPIKLGLHELIAKRHIFQEMKEPLKVKIYNKIAPPNRPPAFFSMEEGISKIRDGLFAFHVELGSGYEVIRETFTEDEMCSLYEISIMQKTDVWLVMRKHSPYKKLFTYGLQKIREFGIANREEQRWVAKKPECNKKHLNFVGVGLVDIRHALITFGVGIITSCILLFGEVIAYRQYKTKTTKVKSLKS